MQMRAHPRLVRLGVLMGSLVLLVSQPLARAQALGRAHLPTAHEAVKQSLDEQHFTQRRKENKQLFFASLCALASLREIVYFFTPSHAVGYVLSPAPRADLINELLRHDTGKEYPTCRMAS
jgi:hypothetical protein